MVFVAIFLGIVIAVVGHELGHVVAGRLVGYRLYYVYLWPLAWVRRNGRWRLGVDTALQNPLGLAGVLPVGVDDDPRRRQGWMLAGGPAASLLLSAVSALLVPVTTGWLLQLALALGSASGVVALLSLVPMRFMGFVSDGAKLWGLMRRAPLMELVLAHLQVAGRMAEGIPFREIPSEVIDILLENSDGALRPIAHYSAYSWHLDGGRPAPAASHLAKTMEELHLLAPLIRRGIQLDLAVDVALSGDPVRARQLVDAAGGATALVDPHARPLALSAIAMAEGRTADGMRALDQATTLVPLAMLPTTQRMARDAIERVRDYE